MDKRTKAISVGAVFIIMAIGIIYSAVTVLKPPSIETSSQQESQTQITPSSKVTYDQNGFSPQSLTVDVGTTVTFENNTELPLWVASDPHPDHTSYPELDTSIEFQDHVPPGNPSYSFKFERRGTWSYHNHSQPEHIATITVK